jgi:hypothetical protein
MEMGVSCFVSGCVRCRYPDEDVVVTPSSDACVHVFSPGNYLLSPLFMNDNYRLLCVLEAK